MFCCRNSILHQEKNENNKNKNFDKKQENNAKKENGNIKVAFFTVIGL